MAGRGIWAGQQWGYVVLTQKTRWVQKVAEWGGLGGRSWGSGEAESRYSHVGLTGNCEIPAGKKGLSAAEKTNLLFITEDNLHY